MSSILKTIFAVLAILFIIGLLADDQTTTPKASPPVQSAASEYTPKALPPVPTAASEYADRPVVPGKNPANDMLTLYSPEEKAAFFTIALGTNGIVCAARSSTFKGYDESSAAYYVISCKDGSAYVLSMPPDPDAPLSYLDCTQAAALGVDCFVKWD